MTHKNKLEIEDRIHKLELKRGKAFLVYAEHNITNCSSFFNKGIAFERARREMVESQKEIIKLRWELKYK